MDSFLYETGHNLGSRTYVYSICIYGTYLYRTYLCDLVTQRINDSQAENSAFGPFRLYTKFNTEIDDSRLKQILAFAC